MSNPFVILKSYFRYKNPGLYSLEKLKLLQKKRLEKHLHYLCKKSSFYRIFGKDIIHRFTDLPLMNKRKMMERFNDLVTIDITKDEAFNLALAAERNREFSPTYHNITVGLSSGTSDHRGLFITSKKEMDLWTGAILARMLPPKGFPFRIAFFLRANSNLYENVNAPGISFHYYDIYQKMDEHIEHLLNFKANILVAPPSVLIVLAEYIRGGKLPLTFNKVISVAEVLEKEDAEELCNVFQQKHIHQVYQSTEGFLGFTCQEGKIHLNEDIVFIEKEDLGSGRFIPIITDFTRKSQPIIRYRLNDILVESSTKCKCGSSFMALDKIEGREDDIFIFDQIGGGKVKLYPDMIRRTLLYVDGIKQYQVIQVDEELIVFYIEWEDDDNWGSVKEEFCKLMNQFQIVQPQLDIKKYEHRITQKLKRIKRL
ncbi:F390 synthetase-related protein [Spirochaeta cellobiosiphila]|uniref:F390 synthetase-related protein n=1 Tax=Spirochaeta cellobiosiphila TaxID=504483 RepID=UPI000416F1E4|nr:F390 synthetase-related protein [Spirochaeta cellobiosiphila]